MILLFWPNTRSLTLFYCVLCIFLVKMTVRTKKTLYLHTNNKYYINNLIFGTSRWKELTLTD